MSERFLFGGTIFLASGACVETAQLPYPLAALATDAHQVGLDEVMK